jgi:hypothetical protein
MLSFARRHFTFANVAMTLALVLAMSGGAFAAGKFLITSTKQISPKVLKSLQGKGGLAGASGAQGPAGPAGPQGPVGPPGAAGTPGTKGEAGPEGKEGKAGKDGKAGLAGVAGSPWAVGGTLPPGKTETGVWAFGNAYSEEEEQVFVPVASFAIQLAAPLSKGHVHFINEENMEVIEPGKEVISTACKGNVAEPTAEPGNLCVYTKVLMPGVTASNSTIGFGGTSDKTGATMLLLLKQGGGGNGTWAVTAESE